MSEIGERKTVRAQHVAVVKPKPAGQAPPKPPVDLSESVHEGYVDLRTDEKYVPFSQDQFNESFAAAKKNLKAGYCVVRSPPRMLRKSKGRGRDDPELPPEINAEVKVSHVFRFTKVTSDGTSSITYGNVFGTLGTIVSVANTTVRCIASSYRVRSVTLYPSAAVAAGNSGTCNLVWVGSHTDQTPDVVYDDSIPSGITATRAYRYKPPKNSLAADWVNNTLADLDLVLFILNAQRGTVCDVEIEFTLVANLVAISRTIASGALGLFSYLALDGVTTNLWVPRSLPTTA